MKGKKVYLGTNTKMYKGVADTVSYLEELCRLTGDLSREALELFVIPAFTALESARRCAPRELVRLGGQNMGWAGEGPYTGEISPKMLLEVGADIAELGHSERRHVLGETDEMVNRKVLCAAEYGLTALLCIGETAEEKARGLADGSAPSSRRGSTAWTPGAQSGSGWPMSPSGPSESTACPPPESTPESATTPFGAP